MIVACIFGGFLIPISLATFATEILSCWSNVTCGCSPKSTMRMKIIGGEEAQENIWGWAVSLRSNGLHRCGGSLISLNFVITAAHCLDSSQKITSLTVRTGSKYLNQQNQERSVWKAFLHRHYSSDTYVNDIAILQLSSPFSMNSGSVAVICLPQNIKTLYPPAESVVVAIGWGVVERERNTPSNTLQQVTLQTSAKNADICRRIIHDENLQLCAGVQGGKKDTCQGDSGGPLMMFSNKQWYLVGITSYGIDCARPNTVGVYTRVGFYQSWILCFLENDTLCIENVFFSRSAALSSNKSPRSIEIFFILFSGFVITVCKT